MSSREVSGVDLAQVALRWRRPGRTAVARRRGRRRGSSVWCCGTGASRWASVPRWSPSGPGRSRAAGASLCERWAATAPDLAEHVAAVGFDPGPGRLIVCPESLAWATKARLEQVRVVAAANAAAGRTIVRALRILYVAPYPRPAGRRRSGAATVPARGLPTCHRRAPRGRAAASGGLGHRGGGVAAERRDAGAESQSVPRAETVPDDTPAPGADACAQRRHQAAATEAAALHRARAERAGTARVIPH
ncbi:DciA family protein [Streptomyces goshikiensis]|uniref:DciA family protein n=1 Tax=Streptomyces goshikiensis TaxID=1942 RepID=UPI0036DC7BB5